MSKISKTHLSASLIPKIFLIPRTPVKEGGKERVEEGREKVASWLLGDGRPCPREISSDAYVLVCT